MLFNFLKRIRSKLQLINISRVVEKYKEAIMTATIPETAAAAATASAIQPNGLKYKNMLAGDLKCWSESLIRIAIHHHSIQIGGYTAIVPG